MNYLNSQIQGTKFYQSLLLIGLILIFIPLSAAAQQSNFSEKERFITIKENMQAAVDSMNKEKLIQARYAMADYTGTSDEKMQRLAYYYIGYAAYRLNTQFSDISEDQKEQYLNEAEKQFQKSVKIDPSFADAYAMLGSVYGMKAAGFFSGMKYGPKANNATEKALKTGPKNPRVHMVNAIGLMNKPSMFGGSTEGAIKEFKKAAELFKSFEPATKLMPDWGRAENYAWLGQAYEQNEQYSEAKKAYKQALEVNPNYQWVKYVLMPQLEEKKK